MLRSATRCLPVLSHAMLRGKAYRGTAEHGRAWQRNARHGKEWQGVRHLLVKGLWQPLFAWICTLAGPPWANCRGMAFRGEFSHRCVRWRGLPGPPAGKWSPETTFRKDLYAGGTSLGHLLGNGLWRLLVYRFVRWRGLPGQPAGKWPPEATFRIYGPRLPPTAPRLPPEGPRWRQGAARGPQVAASWRPRRPPNGSKTASVRPSCLQVAFKQLQDAKMRARSPQDANLTTTWAQLGPTWAQLGPTWPHLGLVLTAQIAILRGRGCIFQHFADFCVKAPMVASRWPQ